MRGLAGWPTRMPCGSRYHGPPVRKPGRPHPRLAERSLFRAAAPKRIARRCDQRPRRRRGGGAGCGIGRMRPERYSAAAIVTNHGTVTTTPITSILYAYFLPLQRSGGHALARRGQGLYPRGSRAPSSARSGASARTRHCAGGRAEPRASESVRAGGRAGTRVLTVGARA